MIVVAAHLDDLKQPPGNLLEKTSGSRRGQHGVRSNQQDRICLVGKEGRRMAFPKSLTTTTSEEAKIDIPPVRRRTAGMIST
jgi:plasmid maintenance system killer protein